MDVGTLKSDVLLKIHHKQRSNGEALLDYDSFFLSNRKNTHAAVPDGHKLGGDGQRVYIGLRLRGGGAEKPKVIKTVLKHKKTTNDDRTIYEASFNSAMTISNSDTCDFIAGVKSLDVAGVTKLKDFLASGRAVSASKLQQLCEFLPEFCALVEANDRITAAMENFRKMVVADVSAKFKDDDGNTSLRLIREAVNDVL